MAAIGTLKKKIQRKFKIRGFTLKTEAIDEAISFLSRFPDAEDEALELLIDELDKETLKSSILDREAIHRVVSLLVEADEAIDPSSEGMSNRVALRVIDSFVVPRFRYDPIKRVFYEHTGNLPIHGEAGDKASLYRDRYQLLLQRLSRDKYFSRPVFDTEMTEADSCEITPIQSLIGCTGRRWLMGVISQLEEGHFYLEDLTAAVPIDLTNAKITSGFFVENTVIVAEGELLSNGNFRVNTCGFPPLEDRDASISLLMGLDFFGGGILSTEETLRLSSLEKKAVNDMFVILSDVWVDNNEKTMEKLAVVLDGYESVEVVPSLFVLMGNFCSHPCNLSFHSFSSLRMQFGKLGEMIKSHPRIKEHSRFLFIPGPDDAGPSKALPRCALPKYLTDELQKNVPNAIFSSNPCRVKFYTQEIVFFRQDLLYRMRRSSLIPPSTEDTSDPFEHLVATITHQSHLCPLPLTIQPIIWNYDHCLRLYPTPHTIVLGDQSEPKDYKYTGITCFNPGSFAHDSTFAAYRPCTQEVELSAL
ncbi:DNA polymerase epsilon subunit B-like isoform X1 [Asparagus officinalis]|uniref:DNA polymerase epsilon subunit B-like isoform X1 n=1 Tax=Asparagus officinalis TaxID=4686 RepID=UPI00098E2976|nr:DNA polymerase epsilon subunit B-like isoform X1 [Asparagus officinalis]XP_020271298.1 DNA polymerase epsilon subunit B-like isoform X1 [Asparagus officinalis]XP_020271299.1 DNA polymerase epsilon subunit B-like isoform X1 [Asparagus officinalis]XP_020271300.1 DNA polymerase epsilon subunit B-like isoform X1 [Asparagus officinalis]XP_020271301.1 DNA polymerase epsilon subunit B-like isoform X1 [Asparagus officinalis]